MPEQHDAHVGRYWFDQWRRLVESGVLCRRVCPPVRRIVETEPTLSRPDGCYVDGYRAFVQDWRADVYVPPRDGD
ncbi:MAG: hypothetical protein JRI25_12190 [Deltaproteobacteria bacterium]|nr:hypothetical protein [Deltaproteobacteria bacterium]